MNEKMFAPIDLSMLPEYLSSGFIGLPASLEPDSDIQSLLYPDNLFVDSCELAATLGEVVLELNEEINYKKKSICSAAYEIKGPISMGKVGNIWFKDEEELSGFRSRMGRLPDIPLEFFSLKVRPEVFDFSSTYVDDINEYCKKKKPRRTNSFGPNQIASTSIGIIRAVELISPIVSLNASIVENRISRTKISVVFVERLLEKSGYLKTISDHSLELLEIYCKAVDELTVKGGRAESARLVQEMKSKIDENSSHKNRLLRVLEKTDDMILGLSEQPSLLDDPELVLQRGIFLATLASKVDSFDYIKKNIKIGSVVEAIATFLVFSRSRLSDIPGELWRENVASFKSVLDSAAISAETRKYQIDFENVPDNANFKINQTLLLNGVVLKNSDISASRNQTIVKAMLEEFGYTVGIAANGDITFNETKNGVVVPIFIEINPNDMSNNTGASVVVSSIIADAGKLINIKKSRNNVMVIACENGVGMMEYDNTDLRIVRNQIASTMDREELESHVSAIILTSVGIQTLLK